MEAMHEVVCGLDVHKESIVACVLAGAHGEEAEDIRVFGTDADELELLSQWLKEHQFPLTAMESTGAYWTPIYNVLTEAGIRCMVVNAQHAKNVPGRKTDMNDARWIAQLTRYGLLNASLIPNRDMQTLRYYTRTYVSLVQDRAREANRIEKLLQTNGFKLSSVLEDILGGTGRAILNHLLKHGSVPLAAVERYRNVRCNHTAEEIAKAVRGIMPKGERWLLRFELEQIDHYDGQIAQLNEQIQQMMSPYSEVVSLMCSIPGISSTSAAQILGEIGADMSNFKSGDQLAAWAGLTPGNHESAGKKSPHASGAAIST